MLICTHCCTRAKHLVAHTGHSISIKGIQRSHLLAWYKKTHMGNRNAPEGWQLLRRGLHWITWHWLVNKPEGCHKLDLEIGSPCCYINKSSSVNPSRATSRSLEINEDTPWFRCISGNLNLTEYVLPLCSYINLIMSYWCRFTATISVLTHHPLTMVSLWH